jgi:hypothetical protein
VLSMLRPNEPVDFPKNSQQALARIRAVRQLGGELKSSHFNTQNIWARPEYKAALAGHLVSLAKCGWCEKICEVRRELNVEHYRPKTRVTHWMGSPNCISDVPPGEIDIGEGYWWLAFEWSNYSLACSPCNQGWKRNLFPLDEPRSSCVEGVEIQEFPLLLNPFSSFKTSDHFRWTQFGYVEPVSRQGEATIVTCGLNRSALVKLRFDMSYLVISELSKLRRELVAQDQFAIVERFGTLRKLCDRDAEFAGMNRWWVERWTGMTWEDLAGVP